jgi:hypothetical protein
MNEITLDEAIIHTEKVIKENKEKCDWHKEHPTVWNDDGRLIEKCNKSVEEHERLAEWLKELEQYRTISTVEECREATKFKKYFDELYGQGLEIANWHQNGDLEPFDNFYDSAIDLKRREIMKDKYLYRAKVKDRLTGHKELDWVIGNLIEEQTEETLTPEKDLISEEERAKIVDTIEGLFNICTNEYELKELLDIFEDTIEQETENVMYELEHF